MALTASLTWYISASFKDRDRNTSDISFYLPAALDAAAATTAGLAVVNAAAALSDAALVSFGILRQQFDWDVTTASIPETSDVERKGVFQWRSTNGQKIKIEVPSIKNTLVVDGTNTINPTDAAVAAFVAAVVNTGIGAGNSPVTNAGVNLVSAFGTPHKIHRGSSKG